MSSWEREEILRETVSDSVHADENHNHTLTLIAYGAASETVTSTPDLIRHTDID